MPDKVELPNGEILEIPDDLTTDQRNALFQTMFKRASAEAVEAKAADAPILPPGIPGAGFTRPSILRGGMDIGAEILGGTAGALAGTPLGPEVAIPAAGAGAVAAKKGSRALQGAMGLNPKPYGLDEGTRDFLYNAAGEGVGRVPLAATRRLRGIYRGGADTEIAARNMGQLFDLGVENPPLYMILEGANPKFDYRGLHEWASKNWFSAGIMRDSAEKASQQASEQFTRMVGSRGSEGALYLPDIEDAGAAVRRGIENYTPTWRNIGTAKYNAVFSEMPRDMPVSWSNTKAFLEDRGALDDILDGLVPDKLKKTHANLRRKYVQEFSPTLYGLTATEVTKPMPFGELQRLRTAIGNRITSWEPNADLPRKDLVDMYKAITRDLESAADSAGVLDEFKDANKYWSDRMSVQEELFSKVDKKVRSEAEVGEAIQRFTKRGGGQGDSKRLIQLREAFGGNSEEWGVVRSYLLKEAGVDQSGNFDPVIFAKRYSRLSDKAKQALLPDKAARESLDNFFEAAEKFGPDLNLGKRKSFSRMTRAEMLGPVSGAMTLGMLGGGVAWSASGNLPAGGSLVLLGTLSLIAPRSAARLMTSQKFTKFATKAMGKKPEVIAGMISRLATDMATLEPEEKIAFAEFFDTFSRVITPAGGAPQQRQQRAPGVLGGM